ncbi:hypothetical protein K488DRAFT_19702, partial [Vararia minispora EC-137]
TDTLSNYLAEQRYLEREAALALPQSFNACTYARGPLRQPVYLCRTCAVPRGLCAACSIACHASHEQLELFPKRAFVCDCPTAALAHPCTLHPRLEPPNLANAYGRNFHGEFCRCGRPYDAMEEVETMIQCLTCEDWFHESCLNLRERPLTPTDARSSSLADADADDTASDTSSSDLPPPLVAAADYDALVCAACVRAHPLLRHYAGTPGALVVLRDALGEAWRIIGRDVEGEETVDVEGNEDGETGTETGESEGNRKRTLSFADASDAKRPRLDSAPSPPPSSSSSLTVPPPLSAPCRKPVPNVTAQRILARPPSDAELGAGDVFFTAGWRDRWCRCAACLPLLQTSPYLLEEEETYEPPADPDSHFSLEELGMRALARLPRDRAIDGIHAFNNMRDGLMAFLRPFAQEGKVVAEEDIHRFFE